MAYRNVKINTLVVAFLFVIINILFFGKHDTADSEKRDMSQKQNVTAPVIFESTIVTKVIDGDTLVIEGGDHVRLLGIDADERGYPCYDNAKVRLEELTLSRAVQLERDTTNKDQYDRLLRHVILEGKNVNETLVAEGLAVARFMGNNIKHKEEIVRAEKNAIANHIGCKWSK